MSVSAFLSVALAASPEAEPPAIGDDPKVSPNVSVRGFRLSSSPSTVGYGHAEGCCTPPRGDRHLPLFRHRGVDAPAQTARARALRRDPARPQRGPAGR